VRSRAQKSVLAGGGAGIIQTMTTSDKITHVMDVLFFVALLVLIFFFARADKEHDRHIASLEGTIQQLQGQVTLLEAKLVPAKSAP
jgi:preprotein translocase subunit SecG